MMSEHVHTVDLRVINDDQSMPYLAQKKRNRTCAEHVREIKTVAYDFSYRFNSPWSEDNMPCALDSPNNP